MSSPHELVGTTYHGITLLAYCGGGAFGDVYYGKDVTGRGLAVKIVPKARLGDHWERELKGVVQYRRITENAAELLKIFHVEDTGDEFFYTMEPADSVSPDRYVPDTLAGRLGKGAIAPDELFGILSGIFSGIRAIHEAGFAHRDIKPENILFVGGIPKLGDIGLLSSLSSSMTTLAGTLEYIPPEMRTADSADTDRVSRCKNDLYAFGKVVYCAVTGEDAGHWPGVPTTLPADLPVKLFVRLALRLCSKDPVQRIATVAGLKREFAEIEHQLKYGETWRDRIRYWQREFLTNSLCVLYDLGRGLRHYWYAVLIALALMSGTIWYMQTQKQGPIQPAVDKPAVNKEAEERAVKQHFRFEVQKKTRIYQQKNEVLLRDFLSRLPYAGDAAFAAAHSHAETFVQRTTKVTFCTSLVYKMAKDRLTGSESLNEALAPIVRQEICTPLADGQAQIQNELQNFLVCLQKNNHQYRADLADLVERPEFKSRDFVSSPDFAKLMVHLEQQVADFAPQKVRTAISAEGDAVLLRSLCSCIRNIAGPPVTKLTSTVSTSAICAAADGPLPFGKVAGTAIGAGGVIWTGYDIYKVSVKLPEELRAELNRLIDNSRTEMRSDAETQAREAARQANEAVLKLAD